MVRVLLCHYFKTQKAFHDLYEPSVITATKDFLFIATAGCSVCVYSVNQPSFPQLYQFPTISKVVKLICNNKGNYVATLESKQRRNSPSFARVYFNWFQSSTGGAVRAVLAGHSIRGDLDGLETHFIAVELPTSYSVAAINSCPATGNIVVAGERKLALFRLCTTEPEVGEDWTTSCDLEHILNIEPGFQIRSIALCDCYVGMQSQLEVRVVKLVFGQEGNEPEVDAKMTVTKSRQHYINPLDELENSKEGSTSEQNEQYEILSQDCILWTFDKGTPKPQSKTTASASFPAQQRQFLFPSVRQDPVYKDRTTEPKSVLGPVSEVDGHPIKLELAGVYGIGFGVAEMQDVHGVTMLYRRFRAEQLTNDEVDSAELHTLQLLPTYTEGVQLNDQMKKFPLIPLSSDEPVLCGMCCLVSGPKEGYIYDVFSNSRLLSCYRYTSDTKLVTASHSLLHAITHQGLETYTVRMHAAASQWIRENQLCSGEISVHSTPPGSPKTQLHFSSGKQGTGNSLEDQSVASVKSVSESSETHTLSCSQDENGLSCTLTDSEQETSVEGPELAHPASVKILTGNKDNVSTVVDSSVIAIKTLPPGNEREPSTAIQPGSAPCQFSEKLEGRQTPLSTLKQSTGDCGRESPKNEHDVVHRGISHAQSYTMTQSESLVCGATASDAVRHAVTSRLTSKLRWALPIHDFEFLKQWSPPADLDVCLIGMHPFVGLEHVAASEENVVLFTRAPQDSLQRSKSFRTKPQKRPPETRENQQEWSVYVLQNMSAVQLYKTVMPLASRCQKHNPQAHHHLVCEQHLFLRSFCVKEHGQGSEGKQLDKLLRESAANLAYLYAGLKSEDPSSCAKLYSMSGLSLRDVVDKTWKSGQIGEGFVYYLDQKLFGSNDSVIVSEATAKKIFRIYSKVKPSRVAELVLMSSLGGFSPETAVAALQDLKKSSEEHSTSYRVQPLDNLVLAVLYLHLCEPEHAQSVLFSVPKKQLIEVVVTHNYLLHEDCKHLTPLAQLLRKHQPGTFLNVLLSLHDRGHAMLDTILGLLEVNKPDVRFNTQAVEFLEAVLNDKSRKDSFSMAVVKLCDIYIQRLADPQPAQRRPAPKSSHQHIPKGNGHFASRFLWLDKLPPFEGWIPAAKECPYIRKGASPQATPYGSPHLSAVSGTSRRFGKYSLLSSSAPIVQREKEGCFCCCCMDSLLKLQALLSSEFTNAELCEFVLTELHGKPFKGDLSIKLLCLPHVGEHAEAIKELLSNCPEITLYYGKQYFGTDVDKWSHLLHILLDRLKDKDVQSHEADEPARILLQVLKGTMSCLASCATPSVLLSLLPDEGSLGFFLPYLEQSYQQCAAGKLSDSLARCKRTNRVTFSL